jgi:hypothetical protein
MDRRSIRSINAESTPSFLIRSNSVPLAITRIPSSVPTTRTMGIFGTDASMRRYCPGCSVRGHLQPNLRQGTAAKNQRIYVADPKSVTAVTIAQLQDSTPPSGQSRRSASGRDAPLLALPGSCHMAPGYPAAPWQNRPGRPMLVRSPFAQKSPGHRRLRCRDSERSIPAWSDRAAVARRAGSSFACRSTLPWYAA